MPARVTLKVVRGTLAGKDYLFDSRATCIIGRSEDCQPQLPTDEQHKTISRHHCLLDINPPSICIRDFGSLNGTYVNGIKIGQRSQDQSRSAAADIVHPEYDLKNGDEIELGNTVFRVEVYTPPACKICALELPTNAAVGAPLLCGKCRLHQEKAALQPPERKCAACGRKLTHEVRGGPKDLALCRSCREDPAQILRALLELAQRGNENAVAIRGYQMIKELGRGGMGAVYLARHEHSGEQVALKVMLPEIAAGEQSRSSFLREIRNTQLLKHPNVVSLRDAGYVNGVYFFTLEYCDGGSADQLLRDHGNRLPVAEAVDIVLQGLAGLDYAHNCFAPGKGIVHRDLKPHNIFLSGAGPRRLAKIGDYGLAKAFDMAGLSGQTRTGSKAGTPVFMPRQQVINFKYAKPEVDVWAMAASLYFMLTGCFARDFQRGKDVWQTVLQSDAVPIRNREPSLPAKLAAVIDRALVDRPALLFQTAGEFKAALQNAL